MRQVVLCLDIPKELELRALRYSMAQGSLGSHEDVLALAALRGLPSGLDLIEAEAQPAVPRRARRRRAG